MEFQFEDTRLFDYTDAELIGYITSLCRLHDFTSVVYLSSQYLAKAFREEELEDALGATRFASQLGIRVPFIYRIIWEGNSIYCIMDRISGTTLEAAWPDLGWLASFRIALQLRRAIRRLRSNVSASSGSLATGKCRSFYIEDSFGLPPRATPGEMNSFLNFWANFVSLRRELNKTRAEHAVCAKPVFLHDDLFVFTHHDLAPRNIMLDHDNRLWLIDWDEAGFYPKSFEHAAMRNFIPDAAWTKYASCRWNMLVCIASGFYGKECRWLEMIRSRSMRNRYARRFNMKANGYAAVAGRADRE